MLDPSQPGRAGALGVGAAVSGTVYTALFLGLAALTRHAVVVGLLFVLVWEGVLGSIFAGVRWLSVGAWGRAVAGEISRQVERCRGRSVSPYAVVAAVLVTAGSRLVHRRPAALVHPARGRVAVFEPRGRPCVWLG